ncbi:MAG: ExbD/TolR family protein [Pirellulaceae bacterium]
MRRPSIYTDRRAALDVKMTPMIDVVFLLLVFFVWTASFRVVEYVLPSQVSEPAAGAAVNRNEPPPPEADFHDVVIRIFWRQGLPRWRVNDEEFESLGAVRNKLEGIYAVLHEAPLTIHPDDETPLGYVIDVYDVTRQVGFEKVQFAVADDA